MQNEIIGKFDTTFFAAIYKYFKAIFVLELELDNLPLYDKNGKQQQVNLHIPSKNKLGITIDNFFCTPFSLEENQSNGMSIYTFFSPQSQILLREFLKENAKIENIEKSMAFINKTIFFSSLSKMYWILRGSLKYQPLLDKYFILFDNLHREYGNEYFDK